MCINIEKSMVTRDVGRPASMTANECARPSPPPAGETLLIHAQTGVLILQRATVPNGRESRVAVKETTRRI